MQFKVNISKTPIFEVETSIEMRWRAGYKVVRSVKPHASSPTARNFLGHSLFHVCQNIDFDPFSTLGFDVDNDRLEFTLESKEHVDVLMDKSLLTFA